MLSAEFSALNDDRLIYYTNKRVVKENVHAQLPLRVPCYDLAPVTEPNLNRPKATFGCFRLPWLDGQ